jgi:geranylgeranyl diphosphate synthase type II
MSPDDFDLELIFQPAAAVESYMSDVIDQRALPGNLRDAARYALLGPGKRVRPILVIRSSEAVGGDAAAAMRAAAAIEMIHCFSLVHDDLPAMDDDDLRRGRPTLHKHTSEAMGILAGDLLTGLAFEHLASADAHATALVRELAAATNDMIAGQVYDTMPDFDETLEPLERLRTIHHNKTAALIRCSCRMGGIIGGADDAQLHGLTRYGEAIGLMFQVIDDLLDVTQTTEKLGKASNKDAEQGKLTYPALLGVEGSRAEVQRLQAQAHDALADLECTDRLRELCDFMAVRTK